jgi:hypothetical protein
MSDGTRLHNEPPWTFDVAVSDIKVEFTHPLRAGRGAPIRCRVTIERVYFAVSKPIVRTSACVPFDSTVAFPGFVAKAVTSLGFNHVESSLERVVDWLERHSIAIEVYGVRGFSDLEPHLEGHSHGSVVVSYFDCATGAIDQVLDLRDDAGTTIGKLSFSAVVREVSEISVQFLRLKLTGLPPVVNSLINKSHKNERVNPYLKYQYSRNWPAVEHGDLKAVYSEVRHGCDSPEWDNLPILRFQSSLADLFRHSIRVHITHHGKFRHIPLGHANLLFRTLVAKGHKLKERDILVFRGDLAKTGMQIEGKLLLSGLPRFAQGQALRAGRPLRTEEGLINFKPLLGWVIAPELPVCESSGADSNSGSSDRSRSDTDGSRRQSRGRATGPASDDEDHKEKSLRHTSHVRGRGSSTDHLDKDSREGGRGGDDNAVDSAQDEALSVPRLNRSRSVGSMPLALDPSLAQGDTEALIIFEEEDEATAPSTKPPLWGSDDDEERLAEVAARTGLAELVLDPTFVPQFDETNPFRS